MPLQKISKIDMRSLKFYNVQKRYLAEKLLCSIICDVNKDLTLKAKAKDLAFKAKANAENMDLKLFPQVLVAS